MLAEPVVVIIRKSNHHAVHLKLIQGCMSIISQYKWGKNKRRVGHEAERQNCPVMFVLN